MQSKHYDRALAMFNEVKEPDIVLCNTALRVCLKALMYREACDIWNQMVEKPPNITSYSMMIELCARLKRADDAERFFGEMKVWMIFMEL